MEQSLKKIAFILENRTGDEHITNLRISGPPERRYSIFQNGKRVPIIGTGNWDYPLRATFITGRDQARIELIEN